MKGLKRLIAALLATALVLCLEIPAFAAVSTYKHDPRLNNETMKDVDYDPSAVYGFSPSSDSVRLSAFKVADWSDPQVVEKGKQDRLNYYSSAKILYDLYSNMLSENKPIEEIAKAVSNMRNQIRLDSYNGNPEGLAMVKKSNLEKYGNGFGPTPESLYEKYGSWEGVLMKSLASNPGMDACVGLYDDQYKNNVLIGEIFVQMQIWHTPHKTA